MWKKIKHYVISIGIALAVGVLAALLTKGNMELYASIKQPPLAPPGWLFPIAWTVLYILMGISSATVFKTVAPNRRAALRVYALQLAFNFVWTLIFFNLQSYLLAFVWILALLALIVIMILRFRKVNPTAAWLQIPYLVWVCFAAYLNLGVFILNR